MQSLEPEINKNKEVSMQETKDMILGGDILSLGSFASAADQMFEAGRRLDQSFLAARTRILEMEKSATDAAPAFALMGGGLLEVVETITDIASASKRNVIESDETLSKIFATSQVLGQEVETLVKDFNNVGINTSNIGKNVEKSVEYIRSIGLNAKTIMGDVLNNMDAMNRFQFEGGVQGLTKMAAQASMLKFDMKQTFDLADRVLDPDRAIEVASSFQRLGISVGDLTDPFSLMNKAINDPSGLQDSIIKAAERFVDFNEETKSFNINPEGVLKLRQIQTETGLSAAELSKAAIAARDLSVRLSKISIDLPEDDRKLLANMAVMRDGEYQVKLVDEKGNETWKNLASVQKDEFNKLKEEQRLAPKTMEEIQTAQLKYTQQIDATARAIKDAMNYGIASTRFVRGNLEGIGQITRTFSDTLASKFSSKDISAGLEEPINKFMDIAKDFTKLKVDERTGKIDEKAKEGLMKDFRDIQVFFDENKTQMMGKKGFNAFVQTIQETYNKTRSERSEIEAFTKEQLGSLLKALGVNVNQPTITTESKQKTPTVTPTPLPVKKQPLSVTPPKTTTEKPPIKIVLPKTEPRKGTESKKETPKDGTAYLDNKELPKLSNLFVNADENLSVNIIKAGTFEGFSQALEKYSASPELRVAPVKATSNYLESTSKANAIAQNEIVEKPKEDKLSQTQKRTEELMKKQTTEISSLTKVDKKTKEQITKDSTSKNNLTKIDDIKTLVNQTEIGKLRKENYEENIDKRINSLSTKTSELDTTKKMSSIEDVNKYVKEIQTSLSETQGIRKESSIEDVKNYIDKIQSTLSETQGIRKESSIEDVNKYVKEIQTSLSQLDVNKKENREQSVDTNTQQKKSSTSRVSESLTQKVEKHIQQIRKEMSENFDSKKTNLDNTKLTYTNKNSPDTQNLTETITKYVQTVQNKVNESGKISDISKVLTTENILNNRLTPNLISPKTETTTQNEPQTINTTLASSLKPFEVMPQKSDLIENLQSIVKTENKNVNELSKSHMTFAPLEVKIDVTGVAGMTTKQVEEILGGTAFKQKLIDVVTQGQMDDSYVKNNKRVPSVPNSRVT